MSLAHPIRALIVALLLLPTAAAAQSPFEPVAQVNDQVITRWELDQRTRLLEALRAPGNVIDEALDALINDRLQLGAARSLGIEVTEEEIAEGMAEFAGRANLSTEQFLQEIGRAGVDSQTFRDFVRAGLAWRAAVRARFGPQVQVGPDDIAKAREQVEPDAGLRVLISEIVLPANTPEARQQAEARAAEIQRITSLDAFAAAARQYSAAPTRERGGRVDWLDVANIPAPVANAVLTLRPGEVTPPLRLPNAVALFQLRAIEETETPAPQNVTLDYAQFFIPGGRTESALAEAQRLRGRVDTCDDLYAVAQGVPENQLQRDELPLSEVPQDVALELARLDPGEASTTLTRGNALVFLMLCDRATAGAEAPTDVALVNRLRSEQLSAMADIWLAELRSEAFIVGEE
ncbi:peptidylprolyl isomerase [Roseitranquillus sediminis]|uniref:peptidylprolyl isomerase n=1 Tax=Roseitranquillus sediminis TaxID=2809051 RepID=UPI001D0BFC17|nr:peptidylprolyl isomerase [Roseitranquillus sediminis]MBM9594368.1 peptidylprolyl isomerase [Roseitranquillus sediminis]